MVAAENNFTETDVISERLGQHKRIKSQLQPVVFGKFIGEDKANGNELGGFITTLSRCTLDNVKSGLKNARVSLRF